MLKRFLLSSVLLINFNIFSQTIHSDVESLVRNADLIISGKVIDQKSEWNTDKSRIFTRVTIEVEEYLKGTIRTNLITLLNPGGEIGSIGEVYSHVPTFTSEEEVLLFLKEDSNTSELKVLDGEAGKISLTVDRVTGEKMTADKKSVTAFKKMINNYDKQQ